MAHENLPEELHRGIDQLTALLAGRTAGELDRVYAPGKWSVRLIVGHLADTEIVFLYRFLKGVGEPGTPIVAFEQDDWVRELEENQRPIALSLQMMSTARMTLAHYVSTLSEEKLARTSVHPHYGPQSARRMAERCVEHFEHHLEQIEAALEGRTWVKKP